MKFEQIHHTVPYIVDGELKSITIRPYDCVILAMPGRHRFDTSPEGGDFVVRVHDEGRGWDWHEFTHTDIFKDIEAKFKDDGELTEQLMKDYLAVIVGTEVPNTWDAVERPVRGLQDKIWEGTIHPETFLHAVQCLAVAEHRRYAVHEAKFGGRFLPFRFAAGIAEGLWTAADAIDKQRRGRPGVQWLEKDHGIPALTKVLMNT